MASRAGGGRTAGALLACLLAACTTTPHERGVAEEPPPPPRSRPGAAAARPFPHPPLDLSRVRVAPEGLTVEQSFVLDLYTLFHARDYRNFRVELPGARVKTAVAHLSIPPGPGPHPLVIVLPILAGDHVVSELVGKALVSEGFAVARLERQALPLETATRIGVVREAFEGTVLDSRRLLDWLVTHPELDPARIGVAGISLGSLQGVLLAAADERVRAGIFLLPGGGLAELLFDTAEKPFIGFRERLMDQHGLPDRETFVAWARPQLESVDPATHAGWLEPEQVLIVSGRFDRVMPGERTRELWEALGRPTWTRLPAGHYQAAPFLWWTMGRGAEHLRAVFGE